VRKNHDFLNKKFSTKIFLNDFVLELLSFNIFIDKLLALQLPFLQTNLEKRFTKFIQWDIATLTLLGCGHMMKLLGNALDHSLLNFDFWRSILISHLCAHRFVLTRMLKLSKFKTFFV